MRPSRIIFFALLSAVAIFMIIATVDIKLSIRKGKQLPNNYILAKKVLPVYKILDIRDCRSIELVQGDTAYIALSVMKDSLAPELKYQIKGDTLLLADRMMSGGRSYTIKIHTTELLQRIIVKNTTLNLNNFRETNISVLLDHSNLIGYQVNDKEKTFTRLNISAKNQSSINFSNISIDSLIIDLQKSEALFMSNLKFVSGDVTDSSTVELRQIEQISLKKDPSSNIKIYD
jgi:hypothetical protein